MGQNALNVQAATGIGEGHVFISDTTLCIGNLNHVVAGGQVIDGIIGCRSCRGATYWSIPGNQVVWRAASHSDQNRARLATDTICPGCIDDKITPGNNIDRMRTAATVG